MIVGRRDETCMVWLHGTRKREEEEGRINMISDVRIRKNKKKVVKGDYVRDHRMR
jgi:hypothetical protein